MRPRRGLRPISTDHHRSSAACVKNAAFFDYPLDGIRQPTSQAGSLSDQVTENSQTLTGEAGWQKRLEACVQSIVCQRARVHAFVQIRFEWRGKELDTLLSV